MFVECNEQLFEFAQFPNRFWYCPDQRILVQLPMRVRQRKHFTRVIEHVHGAKTRTTNKIVSDVKCPTNGDIEPDNLQSYNNLRCVILFRIGSTDVAAAVDAQTSDTAVFTRQSLSQESALTRNGTIRRSIESGAQFVRTICPAQWAVSANDKNQIDLTHLNHCKHS